MQYGYKSFFIILCSENDIQVFGCIAAIGMQQSDKLQNTVGVGKLKSYATKQDDYKSS